MRGLTNLTIRLMIGAGMAIHYAHRAASRVERWLGYP